MAIKSTNLSTMVIFLALSFLLLLPSPLVFSLENSPSPSLSDNNEYIIDPSPSPSSFYDSKYILSPISSPDDSDYGRDISSPDFKRYIQKCGEKLLRNCGKEIRNDLLGIKPVSNACYGELVSIGWTCHKGIVRMAIGSLDNKDDAAKFISNQGRVYYRCLGIINSVAPSSN